MNTPTHNSIKRLLSPAKKALCVIAVILLCIGCTPIFAHANEIAIPEATGFGSIGNPVAAGVKWALGGFATTFLDIAAQLVLNTVAKLLLFSGWILDLIINISIVNMASIISNIGGIGEAINSAWVVFRDLANMLFIFIILYLAFQLILGLGSGHWRSLGWLIIMAIIINFSLFFTKVVIDASNLLALVFYDGIKGTEGLSSTLMDQLQLQTIYSAAEADDVVALFGAATDITNKAVLMVMGSLFILIASFVFLALGLLLVIRFAYLIFLMILSPLAFASYVVPGLRGYFNRWWSKLIEQAFFAPAVFLLIWVSIKILSGMNSVIVTHTGAPNSGTFFDLLAKSASTSAGILITFVLSIIFLIYSLILASKIGAIGASGSVGVLKSLNNRFGSGLAKRGLIAGGSLLQRETIGKLASSITDTAEKTQFGRSRLGASTLAATTGALGASYNQSEKKRESYLKENVISKLGSDGNRIYEELNKSGYSENDRNLIIKTLSDRSRINLENTAQAKGDVKLLAKINEKKSKMNRDDREKFEEVYLREFRDKPQEIAKHMMELKDETLRQHLFDKLSAQDRLAIENSIRSGAGGVPTQNAEAEINKLRASLSPEEKTKTEKAARESVKTITQEEIHKDIDLLTKSLLGAIKQSGANPLDTGGVLSFVDSRGTTQQLNKKGIQQKLAGVNEKTLQLMDIDSLTAIAPALTGGQYRSIQKSADFSPEDKRRIYEAKYKKLIEARQNLDRKAVSDFMGELTPEDVIALDEEDLMDTIVIDNLTKRDLAKLAEKGVKQKVVKKISDTIKQSVGSTVPHEALDYIQTGAGKDFWS